MDTPVYVFDKNEIIKCYRLIKELMGNIPIFYTLKANANKEVLKVLASINADFDVASLGEYNILKEIGISSKKIICGLPVKPINWLEHMYKDGCNCFVFDTIDELAKIKKYAPNAQKILRVGITDILPYCIDFGMTYDEIMARTLADARFKEDTDGILFHISNNVSVEAFNHVFERIKCILKVFDKKDMIVNIGGGYRINAEPIFFANLKQKLLYLKEKYGVNVIAEPGNTVVNTSGCILTTVIGIRKRDDFHYDLYIDAGKPSGIKTDEKRIPGFIRQTIVHNICDEREYRFVDITCMHRPHFSIKLHTEVREGDIFEFGDMGAYTLCLRSDFHAWSVPNVIVK